MGDVVAIEPVYLEAEVAEMLRVHIKVVQRERYAGRLGFIRVGGQVRIRKSDLERYVREQSCHGTQSAPVSTSATIHPIGTSSGRTAKDALSAARRGREIAQSLKAPSRPSSSRGEKPIPPASSR